MVVRFTRIGHSRGKKRTLHVRFTRIGQTCSQGGERGKPRRQAETYAPPLNLNPAFNGIRRRGPSTADSSRQRRNINRWQELLLNPTGVHAEVAIFRNKSGLLKHRPVKRNNRRNAGNRNLSQCAAGAGQANFARRRGNHQLGQH